VSSAGYTITSDDVQFVVTQPANGEFTVAFLPQNNTDITGHTITIHDNAFGLKTTNDYKIEISGYANAVEEFNFGNADARTTSPTTKQITLTGLNNIPGLKISSDDMNTYMVDGKSAAFAPTDGQHTISFNPFHKGQYNDKEIYLYATGANNTIVKYPLIKCDGQGSQVDLSGEINWVNTTIATMDPVTGMAAINNQTYNSYIRLYYTVNTVSSGDFYDYSNAPTGFTVDSSQILALSAGSANITVHVETLDGSDDFTGQSSADITATDKKIQKISYSNNIHYVVLNEDITVNVYAYDSKDPSTHIDADITMTSADSKVTISKGTYDATNFVQPFTIRGNVSGNTKVTITSTPNDAESEYESATLTDIPVTILANGDNCIVSVLNNPNNNTFNTSGTGGETTFALTGAPCRKFTATLNYNFGTPTLNISDGTNTLVNTTYGYTLGSSSEYITYTYNKTSKHKPTLLTVSLTGTGGFIGIEEKEKELIITEYSQLSYFDVITNHPNNSTIDFGTHTIGATSVNETIKVDYSALHKAVSLTLDDETNFTIVNKSAVMGAIHDCSQWGNLDIIIKYNPTTYGTHNATLTIEGYTTDDNDSGSVKTYTYTLKGQGKKRVQTISWKTAESYSIFDIGSTLTLEAESNQPEYGKTTKMPITYTLDNDGGGVATLSGNVLTIAKGGKITVTAHQAGDEYTEAATDETLDITIDATLHFVATQDNRWDNGNNWSPGGIIPTNEYNASIESPCTIESHSACLSLTITESGSLTVNADAVLEVAGTLTNNSAERLTLKADENNSATVLFAEGSPKATVESYIKGTINPNDVPIAGKNNPAWQYRGFAGENPVLNGWDVVILRWNETQNSTNCWETTPPAYNRSGNFSNGEPWDGYSMANYNTDNHIYAYTSTLIPTSQSHTYLLSYTGAQETPNRGVNLITNSWSAPVDMTSNSVTFSGNVEETFYFFNTRSHLEWENDKDGSFVVYPKATGEAIYAGAISNKIASSQSFLIKAKGTGAKLTIGNEALAKEASGAMYAPREKEHFNILTVTMSIDDVEDQLFLVESDKCSSSFDNGYDGTKIRESNRPQIFVINDFGYTAVNATNSILGQKIGYRASADGALCTISFNAERLEGYSELYLLDRVTRKYTNILAGESYKFTGKHSEESERFEIVGRRDDGTEFVVSEKEMIEVIGNYALLSGFKETNEMVYITDLFGRHLWTEHSSNGPMFELPDLPAGVYIIHCGSVNCKFVVK
ncbi:MAG: hypothetical protein KBT40_06855, partial [bacterium]|nr:hypothetical protein [Candidatus Minthenecus merdequi]